MTLEPILEKVQATCKGCNKPLDIRIKRKGVFKLLPVRRYFCPTCRKKRTIFK